MHSLMYTLASAAAADAVPLPPGSEVGDGPLELTAVMCDMEAAAVSRILVVIALLLGAGFSPGEVSEEVRYGVVWSLLFDVVLPLPAACAVARALRCVLALLASPAAWEASPLGAVVAFSDPGSAEIVVAELRRWHAAVAVTAAAAGHFCVRELLAPGGAGTPAPRSPGMSCGCGVLGGSCGAAVRRRRWAASVPREWGKSVLVGDVIRLPNVMMDTLLAIHLRGHYAARYCCDGLTGQGASHPRALSRREGAADTPPVVGKKGDGSAEAERWARDCPPGVRWVPNPTLGMTLEGRPLHFLSSAPAAIPIAGAVLDPNPPPGPWHARCEWRQHPGSLPAIPDGLAELRDLLVGAVGEGGVVDVPKTPPGKKKGTVRRLLREAAPTPLEIELGPAQFRYWCRQAAACAALFAATAAGRRRVDGGAGGDGGACRCGACAGGGGVSGGLHVRVVLAVARLETLGAALTDASAARFAHPAAAAGAAGAEVYVADVAGLTSATGARLNGRRCVVVASTAPAAGAADVVRDSAWFPPPEETSAKIKVANLTRVDLAKCAKCGSPALRRCSVCAGVGYCGVAHEEADQPRHAGVCAMMPASREWLQNATPPRCAAVPTRYDAIDTSNVADKTGLLPVLLSVGSLLRAAPAAALLTRFMAVKNRAEPHRDLLHDHLYGLPLSVVALMTGVAPLDYFATHSTVHTLAYEPRFEQGPSPITLTWRSARSFPGTPGASATPLECAPAVLMELAKAVRVRIGREWQPKRTSLPPGTYDMLNTDMCAPDPALVRMLRTAARCVRMSVAAVEGVVSGVASGIFDSPSATPEAVDGATRRNFLGEMGMSGLLPPDTSLSDPRRGMHLEDNTVSRLLVFVSLHAVAAAYNKLNASCGDIFTPQPTPQVVLMAEISDPTPIIGGIEQYDAPFRRAVLLPPGSAAPPGVLPGMQPVDLEAGRVYLVHAACAAYASAPDLVSPSPSAGTQCGMAAAFAEGMGAALDPPKDTSWVGARWGGGHKIEDGVAGLLVAADVARCRLWQPAAHFCLRMRQRNSLDFPGAGTTFAHTSFGASVEVLSYPLSRCPYIRVLHLTPRTVPMRPDVSTPPGAHPIGMGTVGVGVRDVERPARPEDELDAAAPAPPGVRVSPAWLTSDGGGALELVMCRRVALTHDRVGGGEWGLEAAADAVLGSEDLRCLPQSPYSVLLSAPLAAAAGDFPTVVPAGVFTVPLAFPLLVDVARARVRRSRKLRYLEVVVPLLDGPSSSPFPLHWHHTLAGAPGAIGCATVVPLRPEIAVRVARPWEHLSATRGGSVTARVTEKERVTGGPINRLRWTLELLTSPMHSDGKNVWPFATLQLHDRDAAYVYYCGTVYDAELETMVADVALAPLLPPDLEFPPIPAASIFSPRIVKVDSEEFALLFALAPLAAELARGRVYVHGPGCEYRTRAGSSTEVQDAAASRPAVARRSHAPYVPSSAAFPEPKGGVSFLCRCGAGRGLPDALTQHGAAFAGAFTRCLFPVLGRSPLGAALTARQLDFASGDLPAQHKRSAERRAVPDPAPKAHELIPERRREGMEAMALETMGSALQDQVLFDASRMSMPAAASRCEALLRAASREKE